VAEVVCFPDELRGCAAGAPGVVPGGCGARKAALEGADVIGCGWCKDAGDLLVVDEGSAGEGCSVLAVHATVAETSLIGFALATVTVAVAAVGFSQVARDVVAVGHLGEGGIAVRG
jgi:hypothetical protein